MLKVVAKKQKKKKTSGHNCPGKSLSQNMIGAYLCINGREIKGVGRRKNGTPFDDQAIKAFSQWSWYWRADIETRLIGPEGDTKTVTDTYIAKKPMNLFDLEAVLFERQTLTVISEDGYKFVDKIWTAKITKSPI